MSKLKTRRMCIFDFDMDIQRRYPELWQVIRNNSISSQCTLVNFATDHDRLVYNATPNAIVYREEVRLQLWNHICDNELLHDLWIL